MPPPTPPSRATIGARIGNRRLFLRFHNCGGASRVNPVPKATSCYLVQRSKKTLTLALCPVLSFVHSILPLTNKPWSVPYFPPISPLHMHPGRQKVDVVGPQHIGVDLATRLAGALLQTVDVETVILVRMETRRNQSPPYRDGGQRWHR